MTRRSATLLALTLTLYGCPTPAPPPADVPGDRADSGACETNGAELTVGTGRDSTLATFRPLSDGDDVYLVPGPQGGQHVWIGLRARGVDPTQPRVELHAYRASDGHEVGGLRVRLRMIPTDEPGVVGLPGQTLIFDDDEYCSVLPGDVRVTVDFNDAAGHCFRLEKRVHVTGVDPLALEIDREARLRCCAQRLPRCYPDGGAAGDGGATGDVLDAE